MNVYFNPIRDFAGIDAMLQFACWEWSMRTGTRINYMGRTTEPMIPNAVIVRISNSEEWLAIPGFSSWNPGAFATTQNNREFTVGINPFFPNVTLGLMTHEIGHCLNFSVGHSSDPDDIMHPNAAANLGITSADMLTRTEGDGISTPVVGTPDRTSAILLPGMDVWHPDIRGADGQGYQGYLTYAGRENGEHVWDLTSYAINPRSTGTSESHFDAAGNVFLHQVLSPDARHTNARLEFRHSQRWALVSIE